MSAFTPEGQERFATRLPARGHDVAIHPGLRQAVVFARRPGQWFSVIDSETGIALQTVLAPAGRHFYGHGCFTADGRMLLATENDIATGEGMIALYDARNYARIGDYSAGGIGPHDIALLPNGLAIVANGGTRTHPDQGRTILNRDSMAPNLALVDPLRGTTSARHELPKSLHQLSIRHLAVSNDGEVTFACQYEGEDEAMPPLIGILARDRLSLFDMPDEDLASFANYIGSIALDASGSLIAATSPEGNSIALFDRPSRRYLGKRSLSDVCGVAPAREVGALLLTSGNGGVRIIDPKTPALRGLPESGLDRWIWDNHLALDV
jgi:uncharacterized protein